MARPTGSIDDNIVPETGHATVPLPRAVPLRFGYMRLAEGNKNAAEHRAALMAAGIEKLYEDNPAVPFAHPQFTDMLNATKPHDIIVLVRFSHLSTYGDALGAMLQEICNRRLGIQLVGAEWADSAPSTAALAAFFAFVPQKELAKCGGDGGGGD